MKKESLDNIKLIIPMSGIGKRFIDAGYRIPKPLISVDGKPIIQHVVELFPGIDDINFICNENHINDTNMYSVLKSLYPNSKIHTIERKRGPVEAVSSIEYDIEDDKEIIVSYCDYGTVWNFNKFIKRTRETNSDGCIACYTGFHPHMLGSDNYAFCKKDGENVIEVREKQPFTNNKMSEEASNGTYYFKNGAILKKYFKELIDSNISVNGEFYVSLVYNLLIRDGLKVTTHLIDKMLQWGTPDDLTEYLNWSRCFKRNKRYLSISECPKDTTLIMPMAGDGSRFSKDGFDLPKPLIPVDGKPMVLQAMSYLPKCDNYTFLCKKDHIVEYGIDKTILENYKKADIIPIEKTTKGQACTCEIAVKKLNPENPIFISSCDNGALYNDFYHNYLMGCKEIDVIVWTFLGNQTSKINPNMYSWVNMNSDNFNMASSISTKKFNQKNPMNSNAIIGTFFFRKAKYFTDGLNSLYSQGITTNGEYYIDDVVQQNILSGLNVEVFQVSNYIGWGTPNDYNTYLYWKEYFK